MSAAGVHPARVWLALENQSAEDHAYGLACGWMTSRIRAYRAVARRECDRTHDGVKTTIDETVRPAITSDRLDRGGSHAAWRLQLLAQRYAGQRAGHDG